MLGNEFKISKVKSSVNRTDVLKRKKQTNKQMNLLLNIVAAVPCNYPLHIQLFECYSLLIDSLLVVKFACNILAYFYFYTLKTRFGLRLHN